MQRRTSQANSSKRESTCDRRPGDADSRRALVEWPAPDSRTDWLNAPPSRDVRPRRTLVADPMLVDGPDRSSAPKPMSNPRLEASETLGAIGEEDEATVRGRVANEARE